MSKLKLISVAAFMLLSTFCNAQKVINNYISKFLQTAKDLSAEYGIPVSIILGVSIHESGSGTSRNCRQLNNYFGMKGRNSLKKRRTAYKQYATPEDSFKDFCGMLSRKKFYSRLKDNMNYKQWLTAMNNANYAAAKGVWVSRISGIITKYKLSSHDVQ